MPQLTRTNLTAYGREFGRVLPIALLLLSSSLGFSADKSKPAAETIRATAMGTGTQMGQNASVTLIIYDYSTLDDRQNLVQAFQKGKDQGLVNALSKMKAVGHFTMGGGMGYDVSYIRSTPTPTGQQIRFITNRQIGNGEIIADSQSQAFNLTAGEINLNAAHKNKSTGFLYPAAELVIDKQGEFQFRLNQNSWNLIDILDFKGTPGVN